MQDTLAQRRLRMTKQPDRWGDGDQALVMLDDLMLRVMSASHIPVDIHRVRRNAEAEHGGDVGHLEETVIAAGI